MKVELMAVDRLVPYARNPRVNDNAVDAVAASIREFGFRVPVVCDESMTLLTGHTRLKAAHKLGLKEIPVHVAENLTEAQKKAFRIADNKLGELAEWDNDLLALELEDLRMADFDLGMLAFDEGEVDELLASLDATPEGETDPDAAPPVQADAVSKLGDVWVMGKHRIMCGDSTDAEMVGRLMNGEKAMLMQTDPPYGVDYANDERPNPGVAKPRVANDDLMNGEKLQAFLEAAIRAALPHLDRHAAFYLWHPMLTQGTFFAAAAAADILIHRQIIWAKPVLLLGRGDYHWKHELCFYGWVRGNRPPFYGQRNQTTVWEIDSVSQAERKEMNHATPKPVAIWLPPIDNHTKSGEIMYEPFSGSGSQIIAAEQTGRRCYAIELSPQYVDVAVRRWQQFTGKVATLESTGAPFPEKLGADGTA